jgi:nicotinate-nucleotide adenylyltransferase
MLDTPQIEISASEIRARVARGLSIHKLVPEPVERYIIKNRLYVR